MSLAHRTIDSLYKELVEEGLLIKAKTVNLSDYIGKVHILQLILGLVSPNLPAIQYSLTPISSQE